MSRPFEIRIHNIPAYAILSHTWGEDEDEVNFDDIKQESGKAKKGYAKIKFCRDQAARDGLRYFWVDTCCIDKSNNVELTEAINSMFRWYQSAAKCYVYLSDVSFNKGWQRSFQKSRWFTRGWTLQELIASPVVEFFSSECTLLGNKRSLEHEVHNITKIPVEVLQGSPPSTYSVEKRISWMTGRQTTRDEDMAYSLLGIFNVHMPLIYGEGRISALNRLKEEVHRRSNSALWHLNLERTGTGTDDGNEDLAWAKRDRDSNDGINLVRTALFTLYFRFV